MRIVVLASRFPYPLEKGDKLRMYWHIRSLSEIHEVHLCCITHQKVSSVDFDHLSQFCKSIHVFSISYMDLVWQILRGFFEGLPVSIAYFTNKRIQRSINRLIANEEFDGLYCQLIRMVEYTHSFHRYKVIDYMDAFSEIMRKRSLQYPLFLRLFLKWESRRLQHYEQSAIGRFNNHIFISSRDANNISKDTSKMLILPNGIDLHYFNQLPGNLGREFDLGFIGNMGYHPNVDAAQRLVRKILPQLPKKTTVLLAGARPHLSIQNLASDKIFVSGWLEDIRMAYNSIKIFVAPIELGGGQQNKVLEALALGVPCVISKQTADGLDPLIHKFVSVATSEIEFVKAILEILGNYPSAKLKAKEAQSYLEGTHHWSYINQPLIHLFQNTVQYS